jgi:hypothetical protein
MTARIELEDYVRGIIEKHFHVLDIYRCAWYVLCLELKSSKHSRMQIYLEEFGDQVDIYLSDPIYDYMVKQQTFRVTESSLQLFEQKITTYLTKERCMIRSLASRCLEKVPNTSMVCNYVLASTK